MLRVVAGLVGWALTVGGVVQLLADALTYENLGALVAQDWLAGKHSVWLDAALNSQSGTQAWLIVVFVAVIYWLLGGIQALPLLIIIYSAITAFTPLIVYRIAKQLGATPRIAAIGAWLVALSPAFAFWSGALYKEGLVMLFMTLALYHTLRLQDKVSVRSIVFVAISLVALTGLRAYLSILLGSVILFGLVLGRRNQGKQYAAAVVLVRQVFVISLFVVALGVFGFTGIVQRILPDDPSETFRQFQSSRSDLATAGSGYLQGADVSTPTKALSFLPVGIFYFITVPFPWDFGPLRQNLIIPEMTVWLLLYPLLFVGMLRGLKKNFQGSILLIAMSLALCIFYALLVGNVGTAYRLRVQVWILWAVFFGWGWEWFHEQMERRRIGGRQRHRIPSRRVPTDWDAETDAV